ncbi:CBN-GLO-4 protein [Caenorhabditis brenneri]|uniref:CBN-GLO-4 protein n=1 Tax=Caenorhabditis brenneri TaxID=135651 RepID=G0NTW5_CAEBE|nr:CBN-GLO-4 protein [Caenorhabditis brenneri]
MFFKKVISPRKTSTNSNSDTSSTSSESSSLPILHGRKTGVSPRKGTVHRQSGKKARRKMMDNPYVCSLELDELSADDSIIDYSVFSDDSFLLILLLTSKGDVQAYLETSRDTKPRKNVVNIRATCSINVNPVTVCIGSQAAFVIFGLADGNLLVTPIRLLIDVTWGGSSWATTTVIDLSLPSIDPCLATPTCTKCFVSNFPPCTMAVVANKAGNILLVDLHLRKCVSELKAPQSLHQIDILLDENSIELLVTGFTGAQWIIPIERNGKGFREVLTTCVPSDLTVLEPATMQFFAAETCGVIALDTADSIVEVYNTFHSLAHSSKRTFKVPPETWMVHAGDNVLFTVSNENEIRSALHFGFMSTRLEYSIVRTPSSNWRPLGIVAMPHRQHKLAGIFVVNERGLIRVEQSSALSLIKIASEFFFRLSPLQLTSKSVVQVANACGIDTAEFQCALIPNLLSTRKNRQLTNKELAQIYGIAKTINLSMSDLLKTFENESIGEQLLPEVLNIIQTNPAKHDNLMQRVVEMFVKRAISAEGNMEKIREYDAELSNFLARHEHLYKGALECAKAGMWKCTQTLVRRGVHETKSIDTSTEVLSHIVKNGIQIWKTLNPTDRLQVMSLVCHLDWSKLSDADGARVCALLSAWQRDINLPSYHEMCLRVAITNSDRFTRPCQILSLVSSVHILAEKKLINPSHIPDFAPLSGGNNCGAAITEDDRIMIWGNFTNAQQRMEIPQNAKSKRADSVTNGAPAMPTPKPEQQLPRVLEYPGGRPRVIACGAEHILVLSSSGQLSAWGGNRYGQCGVGHSFRLANLQQVDGDWPAIEKIACGQFHSAFVCADGSLWTFGWGIWGQLGQGGRFNSNLLIPKKVNGLISKITHVACGRAHTVALTDNGRVLICGSGSYGQMGVDEDIKKTFSFTTLPLGTLRVKFIATHYYHSLCVTDDDRIFEWGRNPQELKMRMFVMKKIRSAQIKNSEDPSSPLPTNGTNGVTPRINLNLPAEIPRDDLGLREVKHFLDGAIVDIACGLSHSALITSEGSLYTWGKGLDYQLGHGNKNERMEPHQVFEPTGATWTNVSLGNNHTIGATEDGTVYAWGKNDFGQCGVVTKKNGTSNDATKKFFFQARDGRRFMPNVDESQFIQKPGSIPDVRIRTTTNDGTEGVDKEEIVDRLKASDITVVQAVSKHLCSSPEVKINGSIIEEEQELQKPNIYNNEDGPLCTTTALVHLMAGDVKRAIRMIQWLKTDSGTNDKSLLALSSLVWEVMANHEDVQSREALSAAFRHVPMSDSMRKGKQIAQLWPAVWNDERVQSTLSIDEKIAMLDSFTSASKPVSCPTIPSSSLEVSSKIRVYAQCSHAEPAVVGSPPECSTCLDEWTEKVRHTLGTPL